MRGGQSNRKWFKPFYLVFARSAGKAFTFGSLGVGNSEGDFAKVSKEGLKFLLEALAFTLI